MLTRILSDAFDNSLFIACLSPLETDKSESICTLKYESEFYTIEKKLILNNKSSKDCLIAKYFLLSQIRKKANNDFSDFVKKIII